MNRTTEYITANGILRVPHATSLERAQEREGWVPFFVAIDLDPERNDGVQKVVSYKRATA